MNKFVSWFVECFSIGVGAGVIYLIFVNLIPASDMEKRIIALEKEVAEMQHVMEVED